MIDGLYHQDPWLDPLIAKVIYTKLETSIPWEERIYSNGTKLPRQTCWFGDSGITYDYSGLHNEPVPWDPIVLELKAMAEAKAKAILGNPVRFNSCLANYYPSGRNSVGWHADNERGLGPTPTIVSVSFGDTRTFWIRPKGSDKIIDLPLTSGSIVIMHGSFQAKHLHAVLKEPGRGPRVNLTYRYVMV